MFLGFRARVALMFGLLVAFVLGCLSLAIGQRVSAGMEQDQGEALAALGRHAAVAFSEGLYERLREVELLAAALDPARVALEPGAWQPLIDRLQDPQRRYAWIGVADAGGRVRAATGNLLVGASVAERPWFQEAVQGHSVVLDVHGAKLLAKLLPPEPDGAPLRLIDFAAPLRDGEGKLVGVLGTHGNWRWARDVVANVRSDRARERGVEFFILDRERRVIHHAGTEAEPTETVDVARLPSGRAMRNTWSDGRDYLTVAVPVKPRTPTADLGWTVVVRQPVEVVLATAHHARDLVLLAGLGAAAAASALAWLLLGRFSGPLRRIGEAARRIGAGEADVRIPAVGRTRELRQLSSSLARMHGHLREANERLEARVAERTRELERANAELDLLATRDELTGLANRRAVETRLVEELARHRRTGGSLTVMLGDIDHFKRINDTIGHAAGDLALRVVAERLAGACRATDVVARFGGEEFLVLLPETAAGGAAVAAQKLLRAVSDVPVPGVGTVTLSLGVVPQAEGFAHATAALKAADDALYAAKRTGRNRAVVHGELSTV